MTEEAKVEPCPACGASEIHWELCAEPHRLSHPDLKAERDALVDDLIRTGQALSDFIKGTDMRVYASDWELRKFRAALRALQSGASGEVG